ncbi:MAG: hypothetical protein ACK5LC_06510 [Coprobacillaceae bacterium]
MDGLMGWISTLTGGIVLFLIKELYKTRKHNKVLEKDLEEEKAKNDENHTKALLCVLRTDILHDYHKYRKRKSISSYGKENMLMAYESYKKLGGNSFIDSLIRDINLLQVKNEKSEGE